MSDVIIACIILHSVLLNKVEDDVGRLSKVIDNHDIGERGSSDNEGEVDDMEINERV